MTRASHARVQPKTLSSLLNRGFTVFYSFIWVFSQKFQWTFKIKENASLLMKPPHPSQNNTFTSNIWADNHSTGTAQSYDRLPRCILLWPGDLLGFRLRPLPVVQRLVTRIRRHNRRATHSHPPRLRSCRQQQVLWIAVKIRLEGFEDRARD